MTKMKQNNQKGFTLIELLVVIAIIGLLASVVLLALNSARVKARDAKRLADVRQLASAEELYNNDFSAYGTYGQLVSTYIGTIPVAPFGGGCTSSAASYNMTASATTYTINFCLEGVAGGLGTTSGSSAHTATPTGIQ